MQKRLIGFILTSVFVTSMLFAQRSGNPPAPEDFAQRRVTFLTRQLALTADQQQQATAIFTSAGAADAAVRDSLRTAHQSLNDAVKSNDLAAIDRAAAAIGTLTAQTTATSAKAEAAFYQILTPDQQTKYSESRSQGPGAFGRGPGGFGRGPGPRQ